MSSFKSCSAFFYTKICSYDSVQVGMGNFPQIAILDICTVENSGKWSEYHITQQVWNRAYYMPSCFPRELAGAKPPLNSQRKQEGI